MGGLTAGAGVLGAVSEQQAQQDAVNAANRGRIQNYKYQLAIRESNWKRATSDWENQKINYDATVADNSFAAQEGYARGQRQLNEQFKAAAFAEQADMVKLLESQGQMATRGQTGKTAQRIDESILAAFGRNNSIRAASLASSKQGYQQQVEDINRQQNDANRVAFDEVAFAPMPDAAPLKPQMEKGPSKLGLVAGIANAGLSGFNTYQSLQAPKGFDSLKIPQGKGLASSGLFDPAGALDWNTSSSRILT